MGFIKEFISNWKKKRQKQNELDEIKNKAYQEEMKNQAVVMGKKQAELEARFREDIYKEKLKRKKEQIFRRNEQQNNQPTNDIFGLHKQNRLEFFEK